MLAVFWRRKKEEGRKKREEVIRKKDKGQSNQAIKTRVSAVKNVLTVWAVVIVFKFNVKPYWRVAAIALHFRQVGTRHCLLVST
jgi:hypothetical protein